MTLQPDHNIHDQILATLDGFVADDSPIAIAVSGGGDSMALLLALHFFTKQNAPKLKLVALTVDHKLRPDAALEAQKVAQWCQNLGIEHHILNWQFDQMPKSAIQQQARDARYQLMSEYCLQNGIDRLFVAHNLEDNEETFLMRLKRGAGLRGLSAIATNSEWWVNGGTNIQLIRPFLKLNRATLRRFLQQHGQQWFDDASNSDERFERVQVRNFLSETELFEVGSIAQSAVRLARADAAVEFFVDQFWQDNVKHLEHGIAAVKIADFVRVPAELQLRILARLVWTIGGQDNPPRWQKIENLAVQIVGEGRQFCLGNCLIVKKQNILWFGNEGRGAKVGEKTCIQPQQQIEFQQRIYIKNLQLKDIYILNQPASSQHLDQLIERFEGLKNAPKIILKSIPIILDANEQVLPLALPKISHIEVAFKTRR